MPLRELDLYDTRIAGLEPLRGMPLEKLSIHATAVSDLEPLRGLPLKELDLTSTKVTDLSPISEAPIKVLYLSGCRELEQRFDACFFDQRIFRTGRTNNGFIGCGKTNARQNPETLFRQER